jgi:heme exporter protein B
MSSEAASLSIWGAFARQFMRHGKSLVGSPADAINPLLFFFMVVTLFPLGLGPDPQRLASMAPGILWVVALLSSLMVSAKLFASDYEDGSLEQLAMAPYPLSVLVVGSALTVSIRRGGLLLSLLIIPLNVPVLIFGTTAVSEAVINGNTVSWLALLGGLALGSLALLPLAIGAALRVSLDN